jgi:hypothetical protein
MRRIFISIWSLLVGLTLLSACQDDEPVLGERLAKSQISFDVIQDYQADEGGNVVILRNNTPGTVSMWNYGTGRSTRAQDTVQFPFEGEYEIKFSAMTAGGVVEMDPVVIHVTKTNPKYITDPMWTLLSGGEGNEKVWLLDLDADGISKFFKGPVYFSSNNYDPNSDCLQTGECWFWDADWPGNTWITPAGDYGTMTFNLKGGPYVSVNHTMVPQRGMESGTYFLDTRNGILKMTDATPLQNTWANDDVGDWNNFKIISLTESTMQLAARHKSKDEYLIFNYISKEYSDNWTPGEPEEPQPDEGFDPQFAPGELRNILTGGPSSGRFWILDAAGNPVDWVAKGRGWTASPDDSRDWGWNDSWDDAAAGSWIRFDNFAGQNYTRFQDGAITTGTFTIDEQTNEITLVGNTLIQNSGSWMSPSLNDGGNSVIKAVKGFPNDYLSKGIWFGTNYDASKDEWLVFHYMVSQ